ncbi:hypothetical protein Sru01_02420 [Sphaerisporangium rufum]|uniref:NlpC/P60 domain-containing protein n=1 Tax=Sphaerisporangium rufum TaxID=1381558 RepID=A0A919R1E1_9ACTN|nr:C40 family peptidase [Sphaerisporangium rufum]GII75260.1 hypothetical protein Sru01_02420 [Sphaerisporangium rufum]
MISLFVTTVLLSGTALSTGSPTMHARHAEEHPTPPPPSPTEILPPQGATRSTQGATRPAQGATRPARGATRPAQGIARPARGAAGSARFTAITGTGDPAARTRGPIGLPDGDTTGTRTDPADVPDPAAGPRAGAGPGPVRATAGRPLADPSAPSAPMAAAGHRSRSAGVLRTPRSGATRLRPQTNRSRSAGVIAAMVAVRQIGTPYVWGGGSRAGATGGGFDCSGLALYAWGRAGVRLPHYTGSQFTKGARVPISRLRRGDLVFFGGGTGDPSHVGVYLGHGVMVHAPKSGDVVRVVDFTRSAYYRSRYRGAVRPAA